MLLVAESPVQRAGGVSLDPLENPGRLCVAPHDDMDVVGAHVRGMQIEAVVLTDIDDGLQDGLTFVAIELGGRLGERLLPMLVQRSRRR